MMSGKKNWYFADGYLPEKSSSGMEAHEALMLFNLAPTPVAAVIDVYFSDREPIRGIKVTVGAERVLTIRLDHADELDGHAIPPLTQYALHIHAAAPIVCQFGRLDTTQHNMAYYVGVGYAE